MPNLFFSMGPNAVVGHGSLMEALNWTGDYFCKWIRKIATEDIQSVVPTHRAVNSFVRYGDEIHKTLVWTGMLRLLSDATLLADFKLAQATVFLGTRKEE
jgi:hypothetical protein